MPLTGFDALIFDLDGTLVDSMPLHLAAWKQASLVFGFHYDADWLYALGGVPSRKIVGIINEQQGLALDAEQVAGVKNQHYVKLLPRATVFPAMASLLEKWHSRLPMAVGTGSPRVNAEAVLQNTDLGRYMGAVVTADDVEQHKPNPDTFLLAAQRLGVAPERCLVFEDTQIGRQAALAAGMACVMVVDGEPQLSV